MITKEEIDEIIFIFEDIHNKNITFFLDTFLEKLKDETLLNYILQRFNSEYNLNILEKHKVELTKLLQKVDSFIDYIEKVDKDGSEVMILYLKAVKTLI